jgi:hypothetical protein
MSMIESISDLSLPYDFRKVVRGVEELLAEQLAEEREHFDEICDEHGIDLELAGVILGDFKQWCDECRLPSTAHVLSRYLLELYHHAGADFDHLRDIVNAYMIRNGWDVAVPLAATLRYVAEASRAVEHLH